MWRRTVFVMSYEKRKKLPKKEQLALWAEKDNARLARKESFESLKQLRDLRELSRNMALYVRNQETKKVEQEKIAQLPVPSQSEKPKAFDASKSSLATSTVALPPAINDKLGLAVKYLVSKEHQNWALVFDQLEQAGGFKDVTEKDVRKLVYAIPKRQLREVFPAVELLLAGANIQMSPKIVNAFLRSVIVGGSVDSDQIAVVEKYVQQLRQNGKLGRETCEILVEAYGKSGQVHKMEQVINEMNALQLQPSSRVYSNVLTTCVYKTRDHRQAVQLFDLMKFLAGSMAPGSREYQDIIVSYVNNNDIEKALDLYQEMLAKNIEMNQNIMVALARGCASRRQLRFKAWEFMFEIYNMNWKPTVPTLEYMLYLAAQDGDLSLARALYQQLNVLNKTLPRSFGFLMMAYALCSLTKSNSEYLVPAITMHETGRRFRTNMLNLADFTPNLESPEQAVPYLPQVVLTSAQEVLAESSAVLAHTLMVNPSYANTPSINTFLNVAAKLGSFEEFLDRYNQFTFLDTEGIPRTRAAEVTTENIEEEMELIQDNIIGAEDGKSRKPDSMTKSPVLTSLAGSASPTKIARDTYTYLIALQAASKHGNYSFAQSVWTERGLFRKSRRFSTLSRAEKDKLDFAFAHAMVNALTEMKLLDDALAILISTEYQFKWSWNELRPLYAAAVDVGYDKVTRTVRGVVKRALINHEGKIRKKDYKQYVMERGY